MTTTGFVVETPEYLAEQLAGDRKDRVAALRLYRRADSLYPSNSYSKMSRQLQDSVPE